jgi:GntR family transcriptional regulator/MocR family aminotransferase
MDLHITLAGTQDLGRQLYEQLKQAVLSGRLPVGAALPSTRELALRLDVARNTVAGAYEQLIAEGFVEGRRGSGTFVRIAPAHTAPPRKQPPAELALRARPLWSQLELPAERPVDAPRYDFRVGTPDPRLFPYADWRRLVARQLRPPLKPARSYSDPAGHPRLREAIARHLGIARSIRADAADVLVTNGTQQALDLIGRVLLEPGSCVAMEDPGYPLARMSFQAHGVEVASIPVDDEGMTLEALPDRARLVYVTPSHQFPLGMSMTLERRMALLAWAQRRRAAVIEDDYDSEFRFGGRPLEPLHTLDTSGRVLYVGSFSKTLLPGLRLGYVVAPPSLRSALRTAKLVADWHSPPFLQVALAQFIEDGLLARHLRKARRQYQERRERLESALQRHLGDSLKLVSGEAGLHLSVLFRDARVDPDAVVQSARDAGVGVSAVSRFSVSRKPVRGLVIGYGAISASAIDDGVQRLAECIRAIEAVRGRRRR